MPPRPTLKEQATLYATALLLSVGIVSHVRSETRQPATEVPEVIALPPSAAEARLGTGRDTASAGGDVVTSVATEVRETVKEAQRGFLGFDTNIYPGDEAMRKWKTASPYEWVGYYLPAPCHKDPSWSGKRERLEQMGWGIAVIYVGQQVWSGIPRTPGLTYITRRVRAGGTRKNPRYRTVRETRRVAIGECAAARVDAAHGVREAEDAIAKTEAEGFPRGTVIYLDIERVEVMPQRMRDYYRAWTERVLADGRFGVGAYVHTHNANVVFVDMKEAFAKHGVRSEPKMWVAKGKGFHPAAIPEEVGHAFAMAWQGVLDVTRRYAGIKLPIDENVSDSPNPSAPTTSSPQPSPGVAVE
jgi:hypothetical protein